MRNKLTIGGIITLVGTIAFLLWVLSISTQVVTDPTNPQNVANAAEQGAKIVVDQTTPTLLTIILGIVGTFGGGIFAAVLIILSVSYWDSVENFNILPVIEDIFDYFSNGDFSL